MTSYFTSLLTTTTSRVATLRQNLLPTENDGDVKEDTHICRVLRAYYVEKGRRFPEWLPPDPKAPQQVPQETVMTSNVGQNYGGGINQTPTEKPLSSLWDSKRPVQQQQAPAGKNPYNPRRQREEPAAQPPAAQRMPLPSQKLGSYQVANPTMSAKDKFKLEKGSQRSQSPVVSAQAQNSYAPSGKFKDTGYSGNRRGQSAEEPSVFANSPWASNASEFRGGGYDNGGYGSGGGPQGERRGGVPAKPERELGLPSNPRRGYR